MKSSERERTTDYAIKAIDYFLKQEEYTSAILISSIYMDIRLRTLLTERLSPPKGKWKDVHKQLDELNFPTLRNLCRDLNLINPQTATSLSELNACRNKVAHKTTFWKVNFTTEQINQIHRFCASAKTFLSDTKSYR
jgi:hypothetical protein